MPSCLVWPKFPWFRIGLVCLFLTAMIFELKPGCLAFATEAFESSWRALVEIRAPFVFPSDWTMPDWDRVAFEMALILLACQYGFLAHKKTWNSILMLGFLGLLFGIAGDVLWNSPFVLQLQMWRVLWIVVLFDWLAALQVTIACWKKPLKRYIVFLMIAAFFSQEYGGGILLLGFSLMGSSDSTLDVLHKIYLKIHCSNNLKWICIISAFLIFCVWLLLNWTSVEYYDGSNPLDNFGSALFLHVVRGLIRTDLMCLVVAVVFVCYFSRYFIAKNSYFLC